MPGKLFRRWLYLIHRWIGIASCLLFAMWFLSGLVMLYVPYPSLSAAERLAGGEAMDWAAVDVPPPLDRGRLPQDLLLEMRDGLPVWRVAGWDGTHATVTASRGAVLRPVDAAYARRVARRFSGRSPTHVERLARDQWTVAGGFDRHRPLWKVALADASGTQVYVSTTTGAVVQATTRRERFWNWMGSVPHWLYPTVLRQDQSAWRQVVLWVSGPCIAAAVAGLWIGILRTRIGRRRFKGGRMTPYSGWMLWHHVAGLVGGVFLIAWIVSGWLSVDPGHLFRGTEPDRAALRDYQASDPMPPLSLQRLRGIGVGAVTAQLTDHAATPLVVLTYRDGRRLARDAATLRPSQPTTHAIVEAARRLQGSARLLSIDRLMAPDAYWYRVGALPRLPVLRLRFADPANTWLYVDPLSGEILATVDRRQRVYRWAFDLLHKWDLNALTLHRPAWDVLIWLFSILGVVTSVSGVWLGWKRLMIGHRRRP
ncbi:PepSY-associated TM region [Sphingomonas gellani]|uniref:PepSY-associated TM region n=1 Tax=Sphingomonas gellani TaxID=1166340 RepID=A0A1H8GSX3_9SPHN|nr:PepSY domain-containing protein [Sphingomonas gellani]SEN46910.1 PepSY-associated TM region [Sphingomonas gellani]